MDDRMKVAVLIDAENISAKYASTILSEANNLGNVTYKRIYGNWATPQLQSWCQQLLDHAIQPIQQYSNTVGKNSSDSALIIDAMDLLYKKRLDAFCIVSSDSDFTRLASRLRESEMFVLGMGEKKTPRAFISACNRFVYLDLLYQANEESTKKKKDYRTNRHVENARSGAIAGDSVLDESGQNKNAGAGKSCTSKEEQKQTLPKKKAKRTTDQSKSPEKAPTNGAAQRKEPSKVRDIEDTVIYQNQDLNADDDYASGSDIDVVRDTLRSICEDKSDDDGWIHAANLAEILSQRLTDFDCRTFGFKKFVPFVESLKMFKSRSITSKNGPSRVVYFKLLEDWTK